MKDWIALVELSDKYGIEIVCITEPFDQIPAGKLNSNMLAAISQFYSDQLSIRSAEGVERRVRTGLFSGRAPYGYKNYREVGRGLIRVNPEQAENVRRLFNLYAYHQHSLDSLIAAMRTEGRIYSDKHPDFVRSKLYAILTDRSYLGEIKYRGEWLEGKHAPIIDFATFDRVQVLLGNKTTTDTSRSTAAGSSPAATADAQYCARQSTRAAVSTNTTGAPTTTRATIPVTAPPAPNWTSKCSFRPAAH